MPRPLRLSHRRIRANALVREIELIAHAIDAYEKLTICREHLVSILQDSFARLNEHWPHYLKEIEMWPSNLGATHDTPKDRPHVVGLD